MNTLEQTILQEAHLCLIEDLNAKEIVPYLFQNDMVTSEQYEQIEELNETRRTKCKQLLRFITRPNSKCTFTGFVQSLRYKGCYTFLANNLEHILEERLKRKEVKADYSENEENYVVNDKDYDTNKRSDIIYEPVRKINVFTKKRKAMSALAHKLKILSHNGDYKTFQNVVSVIDAKFKMHKLNTIKKVSDRMELADMRFTSYEAEISAKREKYDRSLGDGDVFRHMETVIPFTSNPRVSSMTYLARYGSAVAMKESIDDGLAYIQFAKEHAEYVIPCRDTGMVYYIEVNLLSQKYENTPTESLKATILKTTEQGISQFNSENDELRKDYQRMLMLKMVYCYLGVGLFCNRIANVQTTDGDMDAAKKVLDFIETGDIWEGMEKRRKMLFYVAKAEYYKQQYNGDLAIVHAKEAQKLAEENSWNVELLNICKLVVELQIMRTSHCSRVETQTADDIIAELLGELTEDH